ncbi:hypothetical protein DIPPA_23377 [Diplonema papillatum]|nr:hypothetical protein DIPPA_23377 [Diplonema papillatum]
MPPEEMERLMQGLLDQGSDPTKHLSAVNEFFESLDWPIECSEQGRSFQEVFKRDGYAWFRSLCDRLLGWEVSDLEFATGGSSLEASNVPGTEGIAVTKELLILLAPTGRLMQYLQHLSDPKRVLEHWALCRQGMDPDPTSQYYVAYPYSTLPMGTQRDWYKHWKRAISPPSAVAASAANSRQATVTPFFHHPVWCPVTATTPFISRNADISRVRITPLTYFFLRFTYSLTKKCETYTSRSFIAPDDVIDWAQCQAGRVKRGFASAASVVRSSWVGSADPPPACERVFRTLGAADRIPGFSLVFAAFLSHYVPHPDYPYLYRQVPEPYRRAFKSFSAGFPQTTASSESLPSWTGTLFVATACEMWVKSVLDLAYAVDNPSAAAEKVKPKGTEGVPIVWKINHEAAIEDLRCRTSLAAQPLTAIVRAVRFHDYVHACSTANTGAGRLSPGLLRAVLPPVTCRDVRGSCILMTHLVLTMLIGNRAFTFLAHHQAPLLEYLSMLSALQSPFRPAAVSLTHVAGDRLVKVPTPISSYTEDLNDVPVAWWSVAPERCQRPVGPMHPNRRFFAAFQAAVTALASAAPVDLLGSLPPRGATDVFEYRWVRPHGDDLRALLAILRDRPDLAAQANAAVAEAWGQGSIPVGPDPYGAAEVVSDAIQLLAGQPFLSNWELDCLSAIGKKPSLYQRLAGASPSAWVAPALRLWVPSAQRLVLALSPRPLVWRFFPQLLPPQQQSAGEPAAPFVGSFLWKESKDLLLAALASGTSCQPPPNQHHHPGGSPQAVSPGAAMWRAYAAEMHEAYTTLFTDLLQFLTPQVVGNPACCSDAVVFALHRLVTCVSDAAAYDLLPQGYPAKPPTFFLPPETWHATQLGYRAQESTLARLCFDLALRKQRAAGDGVSSVPAAVFDDICARLSSLSPEVGRLVHELESSQMYQPTPAAAFSSALNGHRDESRLDATDYDGYQLNERGRRKVLSRGAPFEFRDVQRRGDAWVELTSRDSAWRNLREKLPPEQRRRFFPYNRPPTTSEIKWILRATRKLDAYMYKVMDGMFLQGLVSSGFNVQWMDAQEQKPLSLDLSEAIERGHMAASQGLESKHFRVHCNGFNVDIDLPQRWAQQEDQRGFMIRRCLIEPPSLRILSRDYVFCGFLLLLLYVYIYHSWLLYLSLVAGAATAVIGLRQQPLVEAQPL